MSGCNYSNLKNPPDSFDKFQARVSKQMIESSSYDQVYNAVLRPKCLQCHDSRSPNVASYDEVKSKLDKVKEAVFEKHSMPKNDTLSDDQQMILAAWIVAGGPKEAMNGTIEPTPTPIPLAATFASIKANIFDIKCIKCHTTGGKANDIPFETKQQILDSADNIVVPGDPDNSPLVQVLLSNAHKPMPPTQSSITPLTDEQIKVISDWITNGTPD